MHDDALNFATRLIGEVCTHAAPRTMLSDLRTHFARLGLQAAVAHHDTPTLFNWLVQVVSYQGVSDAIAWRYLDEHGSVVFDDIAAALKAGPTCPKLRSHWHFDRCSFAKFAFSCHEPSHLERCPLPQHDLRNGRLNQTAYSLFLFLRDVCAGDVVSWLDERLTTAGSPEAGDYAGRLRAALLEPLGCVYGIASKVLSMALADLLLAGDPGREHWVAAGASMIAVDTLVHNWLHRSGCLRALQAEHPYGPACYGPGGCADIIAAVSAHFDARAYCPEGPAMFPRLVQKAIWLFCSEVGLGRCNGNRIDDRFACSGAGCPLSAKCDRVPLRAMSGRRVASC